jgi:hypothetical protein
VEISEEAGDDGETIDPLDQRPPSYVKAPALAPEPTPYVPHRGPTLDNSWPDPTPIAPKKHKFVPGPALTAFEAEESQPASRTGNANPSAGEGVFQFAPPEEIGSVPAAAEDSFAAAQAAFAAWSAQQERAPAAEAVPRALYEAIVAEKQELQQRLIAVLEERNASDRVPRELFDQVQAEKRQVQEKMMLMLDELLRLRQQPGAQEKEERGANVHPFPGSRKNE